MIEFRNVYKEFICWLIMSMGNKRGQTSMIGKVVGTIFGFFLLAIIVLSIVNFTGGDSLVGAVGTSIEQVSEISMSVFNPLFKFLLGTDTATGDNAFLMGLVFILIAIVVVGTLDSINIFGDTAGQGNLINLAIGIIVSIIGVRFMPQDLWGALTAPSNAFVAAILVGIPFAALFFVSMKIKSTWGRKLLWIFYVLFLSYLIFSRESGGLQAMYIVFLVAALIMTVFDKTAMKFLYKERSESQLEKIKGKANLIERKKMRVEIKNLNDVVADSGATEEEVKEAKAELARLRRKYKVDLSGI